MSIEDLVRAKVRIDKILVENSVAGVSFAEMFSDHAGKENIKRDCKLYRKRRQCAVTEIA
jgi:hypothetical protein